MFTVLFAVGTFILTPAQAEMATICKDSNIGVTYNANTDQCIDSEGTAYDGYKLKEFWYRDRDYKELPTETEEQRLTRISQEQQDKLLHTDFSK